MFGIIVVDVRSGAEARLTSGGGAFASWTADGRSVVFAAEGEIRRVPSEGGAQSVLQRGELPAASPLGETVAFVRGRALWTMSLGRYGGAAARGTRTAVRSARAAALVARRAQARDRGRRRHPRRRRRRTAFAARRASRRLAGHVVTGRRAPRVRGSGGPLHVLDLEHVARERARAVRRLRDGWRGAPPDARPREHRRHRLALRAPVGGAKGWCRAVTRARPRATPLVVLPRACRRSAWPRRGQTAVRVAARGWRAGGGCRRACPPKPCLAESRPAPAGGRRERHVRIGQ